MGMGCVMGAVFFSDTHESHSGWLPGEAPEANTLSAATAQNARRNSALRTHRVHGRSTQDVAQTEVAGRSTYHPSSRRKRRTVASKSCPSALLPPIGTHRFSNPK